MDQTTAASDTCPLELVSGPTVTLYRCGVTSTTGEDEHGETRTTYWYTEYRFAPGEYEMLCEGHLPAGAEWDENLHRLFRQTQHRKTDDLYNEGYRNRRITDNEAWDTYITALDEWNAQVTALATTFSTVVPELPQKPAA